MIEDRLKKLRSFLSKEKLNAVVISKYVNLHYFSGFRGDDTVLVITPKEAYLLTDSRYTEQAAQQAPAFTVLEQKNGLWKKTKKLLERLKVKSAGFEGNDLVYEHYAWLKEHLPQVKLKSVDLDPLRQIKESEEIEKIRKACLIADKAYEDILSYIHAGMTELQVAAYMENYMRELGSEGPSFTTIVASGMRSILPHGVATSKVIERGDFVTMDYGAVYEGYHSDITRTVIVGKATKKQQEIYHHVLEAQELALTMIQPGASGKEVDAAVRAYFDKHGLAKYFGHGLGHSLGLEIHEEPRLSPSSTCEALQPGMLITDEPGVYLPDFGGVRIEDTVLVTEHGCERLTISDKALHVLQ